MWGKKSYTYNDRKDVHTVYINLHSVTCSPLHSYLIYLFNTMSTRSPPPTEILPFNNIITSFFSNTISNSSYVLRLKFHPWNDQSLAYSPSIKGKIIGRIFTKFLMNALWHWSTPQPYNSMVDARVERWKRN